MAIWYGIEAAEGLNVSATLLPAGQYDDSATADAGDTDTASATMVRAHYAMDNMAVGLTQFSAKDVVGMDTTALSFKMGYGMGDVGVSYTSFSAEADDADDTVMVLGGTFEMSEEGTVKVQHQTISRDNSDLDDPSVLSVGYDHALGDNATGYVAYASGSDAGNGDLTRYGHGGGTNTTGPDASVISFGMAYNF